MHSNSIIALGLMAGSALAMPASSLTPTKRSGNNLGAVYMCTSFNWGGQCEHRIFPIDTCQNLGLDIYSIGPDPGYNCQVFKANNCETGSPGSGRAGTLSMTNPGLWTAATLGDFAGHIHSIKCNPIG